MEKSFKVNFRGIDEKEYIKEMTLYEISNDFKKYFNYEIVGAKVDNEICDLSKVINKKCDIEFYDRSSINGNTIYACSVDFLLIVAVKKLLGEEADIKIEYSIDKGVYCSIDYPNFDKKMLSQIEDKMHEMVKMDLIFNKISVDRMDAIKYFKKRKQEDKVKLLKYISNSLINLYRLDDVYDYFFCPLAHSTKDLYEFKLTYLSENGFVLSYPNIYNPETTLNYTHRRMVFDEFLNYTKWGKTIGISTAAELNEYVSTGKYDDIIRLSEAHYESQLSSIADQIYNNKNQIKLVLIAGPSSSGKTTTSKKLAVYLQSRGFNTHTLSTDDYFVDRDKAPRDENGELDLECLECVDVNLFNRHLTKLLDGEKVNLPRYNFIAGKREIRKEAVSLGERDILIIEGIHGLNEDLTPSVERKRKFKIYISPLTQLNIDNHNRIHTSDTRRLRRIIRDNKTRGYTAADTLRAWPKIRIGEEKYIFPYQDDCDAIINSALIYELGVLKTYAEPLLFSVTENDETYPEAIRLINFLRNFLPIPSDDIPKDSILREFIGGSGFAEKER